MKILSMVRGATTTAAAAAIVIVSANPALAVADVGQPDVAVPNSVVDTGNTRVCDFGYIPPKSKVTFLSTGVGVGTAYETGNLKAAYTNCSDVAQTYSVTITDTPWVSGQPTRTITRSATGALPNVTASQSVGYSLTARQGGTVTFLFKMKTPLSPIATCFQDVWEVSAAGNPAPVVQTGAYQCL